MLNHFVERHVAQCRECQQMQHAVCVNLFALLGEVDEFLMLRWGERLRLPFGDQLVQPLLDSWRAIRPR